MYCLGMRHWTVNGLLSLPRMNRDGLGIRYTRTINPEYEILGQLNVTSQVSTRTALDEG